MILSFNEKSQKTDNNVPFSEPLERDKTIETMRAFRSMWKSKSASVKLRPKDPRNGTNYVPADTSMLAVSEKVKDLISSNEKKSSKFPLTIIDQIDWIKDFNSKENLKTASIITPQSEEPTAPFKRNLSKSANQNSCHRIIYQSNLESNNLEHVTRSIQNNPIIRKWLLTRAALRDSTSTSKIPVLQMKHKSPGFEFKIGLPDEKSTSTTHAPKPLVTRPRRQVNIHTPSIQRFHKEVHIQFVEDTIPFKLQDLPEHIRRQMGRPTSLQNSKVSKRGLGSDILRITKSAGSKSVRDQMKKAKSQMSVLKSPRSIRGRLGLEGKPILEHASKPNDSDKLMISSNDINALKPTDSDTNANNSHNVIVNEAKAPSDDIFHQRLQETILKDGQTNNLNPVFEDATANKSLLDFLPSGNQNEILKARRVWRRATDSEKALFSKMLIQSRVNKISKGDLLDDVLPEQLEDDKIKNRKESHEIGMTVTGTSDNVFSHREQERNP